jgi:tryptophanyl-tRNA synthetase
MKRIFSGVQPTGNLHLGNYLGAIRNWVNLQSQDTECIYGIMNLHAITVPQEPQALRRATHEVAAALIACGIDPKKSIIFQQSSVSAHAELAWILSCHTPLGWLNRMTQFKEKSGKNRENAPLGLYGYPVLMAADVLAYKATHVPVGEDQKQHIELMRDIAGAFNRAYNTDFFPLPEPLILGAATRIMSLRDGTKKMSKSDESDYSRINLTDDAEAIDLKFRKAKSDMFEGIAFDEEKRPEAANLVNIFAALANTTPEAVVKDYGSRNFSEFKKALAALAIEQLTPITSLMRELLKDVSYIDEVLKNGAERANKIASKHLKQVQETIGFIADV